MREIEDGTVLDSERTCENYRSAMASAVGNSLPDAPPDLGKMPLNKSESAEKWVYAAEILNSRCIAERRPSPQGKVDSGISSTLGSGWSSPTPVGSAGA